MRILKIRLKNINSLRGEHCVDFDASPLRESGLFGIVGPMGSGKSTLLDSITLALYGRVPRMGQVTKGSLEKGGAMLTKHEKECFAELTYACKNGVFTARWSVSKTRNDTFRDIEMKVFNEAGDQLSDGVKDASAVNVANIGLDYDQFVKSILLCQGEFAKFLQSGKNERALLLEKITGIHEFRRIGRKAFQEYSRRKGELDSKMQVISDMSRNLLGDEIRGQLQQEIDELTGRLADGGKKLDEAKEKQGQKTRLQQLKEKITEQEKRKQGALDELNDFQANHGAALLHYEKLYVHKDQLAEHARLLAEITTVDQKIKGFNQQIDHRQADMENLVLELREWVGEEVSLADYIQHLRAFRDRVRDALSKKDEKQRALKACEVRLSPLLNMQAFQLEKSLFKRDYSNEQLLAKLRARKEDESKAFRNAMSANAFPQQGLEELRASISDTISDLGQLKLEVRSYKAQADQIRLCMQRMADLQQKQGEFDMNLLRRLFDEASIAYEKAKLERDQLLAAEKLDELRKSLKDGEPCPLCGSEHHPYLHGFAVDVLHAGDSLEKARLSYEQCRLAFEDGQLQISQIAGNLKREQDGMNGF